MKLGSVSGEFSRRWDHGLQIDLILRVEPQTDFAATKNALEHQVGEPFGVRDAVGRIFELMLARFSAGLHSFTKPSDV